MTSAAITDHGVMYGVIEFYKYAKSIGIHPILGCEVYVAPGNMEEKVDKRSDIFILYCLQKIIVGYQNLLKIVSLGFTNGSTTGHVLILKRWSNTMKVLLPSVPASLRSL